MNKETILGLKKKNAAGIVYEYLRHHLHEEDLLDLSPALLLKDIYDCRVCAFACMQVYCKGIMDGICDNVFGMESVLTEEEAEEIVRRILWPEMRKVRESMAPSAPFKPLEESQMLAEHGYVFLVDVRNENAYAKDHPEFSVNIPLARILEKPECVEIARAETEVESQSVVLFCDAGHLSLTAANCLLDYGYKKVYYTSLPRA